MRAEEGEGGVGEGRAEGATATFPFEGGNEETHSIDRNAFLGGLFDIRPATTANDI